jgi:hypothetical protein
VTPPSRSSPEQIVGVGSKITSSACVHLSCFVIKRKVFKFTNNCKQRKKRRPRGVFITEDTMKIDPKLFDLKPTFAEIRYYNQVN